MRKNIVFALFLAVLLFVSSGIPTLKVDAGIQMSEINQSTFEDGAYWRNSNEDVVAEKEKLTFTKDSTIDTSYILKQSIKVDSVFDEVAIVDCTINFKQIPQNNKFIIAFGLQGLTSLPGSEGNVEVYFANDGGIKVGIVSYEEQETPVTVCEAKKVGFSLNQNIKIRITLGGDKKIKVNIGGKNICTGTLPVTGEGRMGFLQTGGCAAEISQFRILAYEYNRPENVNMLEDFERETWDLSKLDVSNYGDWGALRERPGGITVEEYEGSRVLMIKNADSTRISSRYQYSNFEMTFDVPYIQQENVYDEDGRRILTRLSSFTILYGAPNMDMKNYDNNEATDKIMFGGDGTYIKSDKLNKFEPITELPRPYDNFRPFSVRMAVVDGVVTLGMKWVEETNFETFATYTLDGGSPSGYVQMYITYQGSMAIDNLKIVNLDDNPTLIETEFKSGLIDPKDAVYEPFERVYAADKSAAAEVETKFSYYYILLIAAGLGGMLLAVSGLIAFRKNHVSGGEQE